MTLEATPGEGAAISRDRDDTSVRVELSSLTASAAALPVESWDRLLPCYVRVSRLLARLRRPFGRTERDPLVHNRDRLARRIRRILRDVLTAAGRAMARDTPQSF